jgi:hypothetical protein
VAKVTQPIFDEVTPFLALPPHYSTRDLSPEKVAKAMVNQKERLQVRQMCVQQEIQLRQSAKLTHSLTI